MQYVTKLSEIGLSQATTVVNLVTAMPNKCVLFSDIGDVLDAADRPISWGVIEIRKWNNSRWVAKVYSQLTNDNKYYEYAMSGANGTATTWKTIYSD